MEQIFVAKVGDGLCMSIQMDTSHSIIVDCGSGNSVKSRTAYEGYKEILRHNGVADTFILSHFHTDHYNGLRFALSDNMRRFSVDSLIMPCIPIFNDSKRLFLALFTMNLRILGSDTGIKEFELRQLIMALNGNNKFLNSQMVGEGDDITINNGKLKVLWPPKRLTNERILESVKQALKAFEEALKNDETMQILFEIVKCNLEYCEEDGVVIVNEKLADDIIAKPRHIIPKPLNKSGKDANKKLKGVANRLSLAFCDENAQLLFLGDLECNELNQVIENLCDNGNSRFDILVTPHHGTHTGSMINNLHCCYAVSSCGSKMICHLKSVYQKISLLHLSTWVNGNIILGKYKGIWFPTCY